jgi:hypothetical protein
MTYRDLTVPDKLIEVLNLKDIESHSTNADKNYEKSFCRSPVSFWLIILITFFFQINIYGHILTQSSYVAYLGGNQAFAGVVLMMSLLGGFLSCFIYQALSNYSYKMTFLITCILLVIADLFYSKPLLETP